MSSTHQFSWPSKVPWFTSSAVQDATFSQPEIKTMNNEHQQTDDTG